MLSEIIQTLITVYLCTPVASAFLTNTFVTAITFGNIGCSSVVLFTIYPTYVTFKTMVETSNISLFLIILTKLSYVNSKSETIHQSIICIDWNQDTTVVIFFTYNHRFYMKRLRLCKYSSCNCPSIEWFDLLSVSCRGTCNLYFKVNNGY